MKALTLLFCMLALSQCAVLPQNTTTPTVQTTSLRFCKEGYIYTRQAGCIRSCSNSDFRNCTNIFPAIYGPKFCALAKNGTWTNYTFACQACGPYNNQYIGIADGACTPDGKPSNSSQGDCRTDSDCQAGEQCSRGSCLNKCAAVLCPIGSICVNGSCVTNPNNTNGTVCPTNSNIKYCTNPRPNNFTCPMIYYFVPPQPQFCGVRADGSRFNFVRECQACKDTSIAYYFDKPCVQAGALCQRGQICQNGRCVSNPQVCTRLCQRGYHCVNNTCVPDAIVCTKLCEIGYHCVNNTCVRNSNSINCRSSSDCGSRQKCSNGACVDICDGVSCPLNQLCQGGSCVARNCSSVNCPSNSACRNGQCIVTVSVCPVNSQHNAVACTSPRPNNSSCPVIYYIRAPDPLYCGVRADGSRVDFPRECETCKDSSIVYYFKVPCGQAPSVCKNGENCQGNICQSPQNSGCQRDSDCRQSWQLCSNGECLDRCAAMRCSSGRCNHGQCLPASGGRGNSDGDQNQNEENGNGNGNNRAAALESTNMNNTSENNSTNP